MKLLVASIMILVATQNLYRQSAPPGRIIPDDYPVSNQMLKDNSRERQNGEVISDNNAWFTNDTLKQTLVVELYADYHRAQIVHFYNSEAPDELIKEVHLEVPNGERYPFSFGPATLAQKKKKLKGLIYMAGKTSQHYFKTKKGFQLGDPKAKATGAYGKPDRCTVARGIEHCQWKYAGDFTDATSKSKTAKPLAKDSYGYSVSMFFKNDKLIAMILINDIP